MDSKIKRVQVLGPHQLMALVLAVYISKSRSNFYRHNSSNKEPTLLPPLTILCSIQGLYQRQQQTDLEFTIIQAQIVQEDQP